MEGASTSGAGVRFAGKGRFEKTSKAILPQLVYSQIGRFSIVCPLLKVGAVRLRAVFCQFLAVEGVYRNCSLITTTRPAVLLSAAVKKRPARKGMRITLQ